MSYSNYPTQDGLSPASGDDSQPEHTELVASHSPALSPEISEILRTVPKVKPPSGGGETLKYLSWIACTAIGCTSLIMVVQVLKPNDPSADVLALQRDTLALQRDAIEQMERPNRCVGICIGGFGGNPSPPRQREQEPRLATDSQENEEPESNADGWLWRVPGGEKFVVDHSTSEFLHPSRTLIHPLHGLVAGDLDAESGQYLYTLIMD